MARQFHAVLLGRDRYFRAELDFEIDEPVPGSIEDAADEQADHYAAVLMADVGRVDVDSVYEMAGPRRYALVANVEKDRDHG